MIKKYQLLNVSTNFAKAIKISSAMEGKTIIEKSEEIAKELEQRFNQIQKENNERRFKFNI